MNIGAYVAITIATISFAMIGTVICGYCDEIALKNVTYPKPFSIYGELDYKLDFNIIVGNATNPDRVNEGETVTFLCDYIPNNATIRNETIFYFNRFDCPGGPETAVIQADRRNFITIPHVSIVHEGLYKCEASGPLGFVATGDIIQLHVIEKHKPNAKPPRKVNRLRHDRAPRLTLVPTGLQTSHKDITVGSKVVLKCVIYSPNPFSPFSLYFNGTPVVKNKQQTFHNGLFFDIPSVEKSDAGNYTCSRDDPDSGLIFSNIYELKVHDVNRACLSNPLNVTLKLNGSADAIQFIDKNSTIVFTCEVSPKPAETEILNVRWYTFTGAEVTLNTSIGLHIFESSLIINRIGYTVEGIYSCRVRTKEGISCSNSISLDVIGLRLNDYYDEKLRIKQQKIMDKLIKPEIPRLKIQLMNRLEGGYVDAFLDVFLKCNVEPKKSPIRKYAWFLRGSRLYTDESLGIICNGSNLTMRGIRVADAGEYICQGIMDNDTVVYSEPYLLRVRHAAGLQHCMPQTKSAPKVLLHFGNELAHGQFLELGDNISMICDVYPDMTSNITYRWFLEGREKIPDENDSRIRMNDTTLQLTGFNETDAGNYVCEAKTELGTVYSNPVKIKVLEYMYNATGPTDNVRLMLTLGDILDPDEIKESDTIYFVCAMFPKILDIENLIWFHNGHELSPEDYPSYKFSNYTLVINNITKQAAGTYRCKLESNQGYVYSRPLELQVKDKSSGEANRTSYTKTPVDATVVMGFADGLEGRIRENEDVYLRCDVKPGTVFVTRNFFWKHNLKELNTTADTRLTIINRGAISTLIIQKVARNYAGGYDCSTRAIDRRWLGTKESKQLDVWDFKTNVPPRMRARLMGGRMNTTNLVKESEVTYITCKIDPRGNNIFRVRWYYNNTELQDSEEIEILPFSLTLVLKNITENSTGYYRCEALTDTDHIESSNSVFVQVVDRSTKEKTASQPVVTITEPGIRLDWTYIGFTKVPFRCEIFPAGAFDENGPYEVEWFLNNVKILKDRGDNRRVNGTYLSVYVIEKKDLGLYYCKIRIKNTLVYSYPAKFYVPDRRHSGVNKIPTVRPGYGKLETDTYSNKLANTLHEIQGGCDDFQHFKQPNLNFTIVLDVKAELQTDKENIHVNDTIYFYCHVYPETNITSIEWFHGIQKINSENEFFISPDDNRTLTVRNLQRNLLGKYSCRIQTNEGPFESDPTLIWEMKNESLDDRDYWDKGNVGVFAKLEGTSLTDQFYEGNDAIFKCVVLPESTKVFSITWYRNDNPLLICRKNLQFDRTLIIRDLKVYESADYKCIAHTKKGTFSSDPVPLKVADIKSVVAELQDCPGLYYENMLAYFYCVIEPPTTKILNLTWYRNNRILNHEHGNITFKANKDYRLLTLQSIKKNYEGYYACEITTENGIYRSKPTPLLAIREGESPYVLGKHEPYLTLDVGGYDFFIKEKAHVYEAQEHSNLQFNCHIKPESTQILNLMWYFNGTQIITRDTDKHKFNGHQNQIMSVYDISIHTAGVYYCKADTKKGPARSKSSVRLIVYPKSSSHPATKP